MPTTDDQLFRSNTNHGEHLTTGGNGRKELPTLEVSTVNEAHITTGGNGKMDTPMS